MTKEDIINEIKPILEELNYPDAVSYLTQNDRGWLEENIRALEQEPKTEKIIKMRDAAPEERESVDKYVKSISKPTGVDFWDLEQEPCDCISRQAVLDLPRIKTHNQWGNVICESVDIENVRQLPPVTPQPKIGRWIKKYGEDSCGERYSRWVCSECGRDVGFNLANIEDVLSEYPYCHCGAKMERSDNEW